MELETDPGHVPIEFRPPPPNLTIVAKNAKFSDLARAIRDSYANTYLIFEKFRVELVIAAPSHVKTASDTTTSQPGCSSGGVTSATLIAGSDMPPDDTKLTSLFPEPDGSVIRLFVAGPGIDLDNTQFRHAGGTMDWIVACTCGVTDDDGERMLCCDECGKWLHAHCTGFEDTDADPEAFTCPRCLARRAC